MRLCTTTQGSPSRTWAGQDAARAFRESVRLNPANHAASDALGVSLGRLKQYPEAVAAAEAAIRLEPDDASYRLHLCDLELAMSKYQQAIAACGEALRLAPDMTAAHRMLGSAYLALEQYDQAAGASGAAPS